MKKTMALVMILLVIALAACGETPAVSSGSSQHTEPPQSTGSFSGSEPLAVASSDAPASQKVQPFADLRGMFGETVVLAEGEYDAADIPTFWYNEETVFEGNEALQATVMENGRNPGLKVRALHGQGVTGAGVSVAVIDQPLFPDHPEFNGKIAGYYEAGSAGANNPSSMHGPAVTSLLAGETIGTAPGVKVFYAAFPSWEGDATYAAEALDWIVEQNAAQGEEGKIRVVSVSADFSSSEDYIHHEAWIASVEKAREAGMLVLDCRVGYDTCVIWPSYWNREAPEDITQSRIGGPSGKFARQPENTLGTPIGYRTTAEHYEEEKPSYAYDAEGGHSWAIPYAAGVFALGWQVNPALAPGEMVDIAFETAYTNDADGVFLNPTAFVDAVRNTVA